MNQPQNTPIYRFCNMTPQQLEGLRMQLGLQMPAQALALCASYYRNRERRLDPTAEVLHLLDTLATLPAPAETAVIRELYTNDAFAASTYADMMNKRRELSPAASAPVTLGEALGLASAYLNRSGKIPILPNISARIRFENDETIREVGRNGIGSPSDLFGRIEDDGMSSAVGVEHSGFSLALRAKELTPIVESDQWILLHNGDLPMWKYRSLVEDFLCHQDISESVKRVLTVSKEGILPLLLRLCRGFCCDVRRLLPVSPDASLSSLVGRYTGCILLSLPGMQAKAVAGAAAKAGLNPLIFAYVASGDRAALVDTSGQTTSLETAFLASLFPRTSVIAKLPDEKGSGHDTVRHIPISTQNCPYLITGQSASERMAGCNHMISAAHAQTGSAFYRTALQTALVPVLSLAVAGKDYAHQRLAVGLIIPTDALSPERTGEAMATALGLYRVQTELGLPASTISVQTDEKAEHPALTVFAYAAGAGTGSPYGTAPNTNPGIQYRISGSRSPLPSHFVSSGNQVYCVAPAIGADGLPDFSLLRRLLSELGALYARGAVCSARVVCGESLNDALSSMSGKGRGYQLSESFAISSDVIPLAVLIESKEHLSYSLVAEVTELPEEEPENELPGLAELPKMPAISLIWSDPREAVVLADRLDVGARMLATRMMQNGIRCSLFHGDADAGPLSRAILTARVVILCGAVSLPIDDRMRFALNTQRAAGGVLVQVGTEASLPSEFPVIHFPDGIPEIGFDRLLVL